MKRGPQQVFVIGGGISGLVAAHEVLRLSPDVEVTVLERQERAGGLMRTERTGDGFVIEHGPDSLVTRKAAAQQLVEDTGLQAELVVGPGVAQGSYLARGGALLALPPGLIGGVPSTARPVLGSSLLGPSAKLRLACELVIPRRRSEADESVASFVTRRFGPSVLRSLVAPLVTGIYGTDATRLSVHASMPQLAELERSYGSVAWGMWRTKPKPTAIAKPASPSFVSFRRGMQSIPDALVAKLQARVRLGVQVDSVAPGKHRRFALHGPDFDGEADALIVAAPAFAAARMLEPIDGELAQLLSDVAYGPLHVLSFAFDTDSFPVALQGTGFVVDPKERRATRSCTFTSNKWPERAAQGVSLMRCFMKTDGGTDAEVEQAALADLRDIVGVRGAPKRVWHNRARRALPLYEVGHLERVSRMQACTRAVGGLALAGNTYGGVGIPECVDTARRAAQATVAALAGT